MRKKINHFLQVTFFQKKLNNWLGVILFLLLGALFGYLVSKDLILGMGLLAAVIGIFVAIVCLSDPEAGLYIISAFSFFAYFFSRLFFKGEMPVGAIFDVLVLITFLGAFVSRRGPVSQTDFGDFIRQPLVIAILLSLVYSAIEFFNPNSMSINTNILAFRKFLGYVFIMFLAYTLFDSMEKARKYLHYLFILFMLTALYGCIQQWHGYFNFEMELILADPHGLGLIFVNGEFRKFSTMSDPSTFGILMGVGSVFYTILGMNEKDQGRKTLYFIGSMLMVLAMGFSGTRTAYATAIGGFGFFVLLNFEKSNTRKFGIVGALVFLVLMFGPGGGNSTIRRFRTTFVGSKDESFKVREMARAFVQPYILSHPIGGGLGTTGFNGVREHPGHYLANFQPDSSYVKRAAETGWIGLLITCALYYLSLQVAIIRFFRAKTQKIKIIYCAIASSLFAFYVAEFAQVAIGGITDAVYYYPMLSMLLKLDKYDKEELQSDEE